MCSKREMEGSAPLRAEPSSDCPSERGLAKTENAPGTYLQCSSNSITTYDQSELLSEACEGVVVIVGKYECVES